METRSKIDEVKVEIKNLKEADSINLDKIMQAYDKLALERRRLRQGIAIVEELYPKADIEKAEKEAEESEDFEKE